MCPSVNWMGVTTQSANEGKSAKKHSKCVLSIFINLVDELQIFVKYVLIMFTEDFTKCFIAPKT